MKKKYNFLPIKLFYIIKIANGGILESNSKYKTNTENNISEELGFIENICQDNHLVTK